MKKYRCPCCKEIVEVALADKYKLTKCPACGGHFTTGFTKVIEPAEEVKEHEIPPGPYTTKEMDNVKNVPIITPAMVMIGAAARPLARETYDQHAVARLFAASWDMWQLLKDINRHDWQYPKDGALHTNIKKILNKIEGGGS